jgi:hypothetical protein
MSLNWSTQKVEYFKQNPDELWVKYRKGTPEEYEDVNAETKALIFGSMALGLGSITEKNASEWYARWKMYEKYAGFTLYSVYDKESNKINEVYLTPEVILKHIGLSMNVSDETTATWCKRFAKPMYREDERPTIIQAKAMVIVLKMEFDSLIKDLNKEMETV